MSKKKKQRPGIPGYGKLFRASHKMARISPYKARPVIDMIRGKNVHDAILLMDHEAKRGAHLIGKVLKSALANASNDLDVNLKELVVVDARINGAGMLNGRRRWQPRAMGRAFPIIKRVSHIEVALAEPVSSEPPAGEELVAAGEAEE